MNEQQENQNSGTPGTRKLLRMSLLVAGIAPVISSLSDELSSNPENPLSTLGQLRRVLDGAEASVRGLEYDDAQRLAPFQGIPLAVNPVEAFPFEKAEGLLNKVVELANAPRPESLVAQTVALSELLAHAEKFNPETRMRMGDIGRTLLDKWEQQVGQTTETASSPDIEVEVTLAPEPAPSIHSPFASAQELEAAVKTVLEKCKAYKALDPDSPEAIALSEELQPLLAPFRPNTAFMELLEIGVG